eukprot:CAMPEP_0194212204 /NCGR_PEP_ID=MMETSP0156-20130528/11917_1 /TAXON_ID=33649 /ORGANISM="Thalassionema nitzschioides, Strain L26-B" /LENGTH=144 /DNA_ID=CAMNT_0038939973 /DNA_START=256 /DNA_END=687 /DNA_ORIENTATION=+
MEWAQDKTSREWRLEPKLQVDSDTVKDHDGQGLFIEHIIQNTDTFQGICLKYKVSPTELRRANYFSGTNLFLAPNPLKVPRHGAVGSVSAVPTKDTLTSIQKIHKLMYAVPSLVQSEAKCYLELNDWGLEEALLDAKNNDENDN